MPPFVTIRAAGRARRSARASSRFVVAVRARRVEDGDAGLDRGGDRRDARLVVREPHAAEADAELRRVEPGRTSQAASLLRGEGILVRVTTIAHWDDLERERAEIGPLCTVLDRPQHPGGEQDGPPEPDRG